MGKLNIDNLLVNNKIRLKEVLNHIPQVPGCYLMLDTKGTILYIGKSKKLRNRVRSYFNVDKYESPRIKLMVKQIADIEIIITDTETEALTLESNLIKEKQPYFNILLKDDKKYPYVCITWSEEYPRIFITRKRRKNSSLDKFYGPFVDVGSLRRTLLLIKRVFPLRQRAIPLYKDRTCLNYPIGRCPGVCQRLITPEEYNKTIKRVAMIFQGRSHELKDLLSKEMENLSERMEYEKAAVIRDQLSDLKNLYESQKMIIADSDISRDVISISSDKTLACIQLFQMRSGKLVGRIGYTCKPDNTDDSSILQRIIEEHYSSVESVQIPKEIFAQYKLPQQELIASWLSEYRGRNVYITNPVRGMNSEIIDLVCKNAEIEHARIKKGELRNKLELEDLTFALNLEKPPRRIEAYDISHIQGTDTVASQVVFIDGLPAKQHYRKYKIYNKSVRSGHSDDYASLSEVIYRRLRKWSKLKSEGVVISQYINTHSEALNTHGLNDWPELIVIDGGKGQLNAACNAIRSLDLENEISICSLAKRHEEVYIPGITDPIHTDKDQLGLTLLRRIRDEAHRFAITFHKQQRNKRMTKSRLSEIPGLGPKRAKELLGYFNSMEAIELATKKELLEAPGVGRQMAMEIWNYFHPENII